MSTEIRVPTLGESVTEAEVIQWFKQAGDAVAVDEPLVELETDKVTIELPSPAAGVLAEITVETGETVEVDALLGMIGDGDGAVVKAKPAAAKEEVKAEPAPKAEPEPAPAPAPAAASDGGSEALSPAVKKLIDENGLDPSMISGSGKDGRIVKGDVLAVLEAKGAAAPAATAATPIAVPAAAKPASTPAVDQGAREERVRMTRLRKTIATRLKEAQNTAAMLTTFNEVDLGAVMAARSQYKELFEKKHGVRLGFMSFFVKACITALKDIPAVNAEIDGDELVYKNFYNIGVAVGTDKGLVVPVLKDAQDLSLAGIEKAINAYGQAARDGNLKIDDLQGGTFTISNGGVYGSLMSTPILNAPQSGILGMHKIQERPMVVNGEIQVRPMMYLALSYDHRIVDGKEAVTFLVRVKECLEDPQRLLLDL
ncbi:MAG: 2-oxoglutarate dehydrogenase complex dihydrolipoyllysine-residue succinyltransferase [Rhodobiaceae bacterium]|nr:dihydrolipoyllysine-residue succinyltransferase component of 2-oxoglutarate dehydrogenase complex [Rhodobiaceae bacterium]MCR9243097.1 2-oxoglutarate dehydrogenase complex dihydrolipoyllysine-residue succinyltransferase [Rhodobiaceae bacterium]